jgi:uncharacterized protein (TIGR02453 family)
MATMATATIETFTGFRPEAIQFLADLAENNDRSWFQPRKGDYERLLKRPLEALCVALDDEFRARDLPLAADPARSPFRIYRDTRFAKDKSPYKTNIGADFPWRFEGVVATDEARGPHGVGGYFHFSPGEVFVGGGMWHPAPARLAGWRRNVMDDPESVHAAIDDLVFVARFGGVHGDSLKRVPPGYPSDHPDAELLKLKDVTFGQRLTDAEALSGNLPSLVADAFAASVPVLRLLAKLPAGE